MTLGSGHSRKGLQITRIVGIQTKPGSLLGGSPKSGGSTGVSQGYHEVP